MNGSAGNFGLWIAARLLDAGWRRFSTAKYTPERSFMYVPVAHLSFRSRHKSMEIVALTFGRAKRWLIHCMGRCMAHLPVPESAYQINTHTNENRSTCYDATCASCTYASNSPTRAEGEGANKIKIIYIRIDGLLLQLFYSIFSSAIRPCLGERRHRIIFICEWEICLRMYMPMSCTSRSRYPADQTMRNWIRRRKFNKIYKCRGLSIIRFTACPSLTYGDTRRGERKRRELFAREASVN